MSKQVPLSQLLATNPTLALAFRLASYFKCRPIAHDTLALGESTHAIKALLLNEEPTSLQEKFEARPLNQYNVGGISSTTPYYNCAYCTSCGTYWEELSTYSTTVLSRLCSNCSQLPVYSLYVDRDYYSPMLAVLTEINLK